MKANQADLPVRTMCRVLRVSPSGYYDWLDRVPSARARANAELTQPIEQIHRSSDATYGAPRVHAELAELGVVAGHNRIARLMRLHGLRGVSRRRGRCVTTRRDKSRQPALDLVQRRFEATGINQLWVADMTYIPTWSGFGYLAVVLDVFSRKIVGWAFGQRQTADLVLAALNMALLTRKARGVIHHSDQGSQYTSLEFGKRCVQMGVRPSMGSVGDAYDNAMAESFFASLECELIDRRIWKILRAGAHGDLHLDRGLVQPAPTPQRPGAEVARELRARQCRQRRCATTLPAKTGYPTGASHLWTSRLRAL